MFKSFEKLPNWQKGLIIIIVIIVLFYLFNYAKGYFAGVKNKATSQGEIQQLESQGIQQSYPDQRYLAFADSIQTAIAGWGTDEESVYNVMRQIKNNIDFLKLQTAFGVRDGETLSQWLLGDLSSAEMLSVNQILSSNGVTYRF